MIDWWIALIEALSIADWVVVFLATKPVFIVVTLATLFWSRRGRDDLKALPGPDASAGLLESEEPSI